MKNLRKIFSIILSVLLCCQWLAAEVRQHQVRPGDTLYSIAHRYEVTVEAIQAANPWIVGTNIPAGSMLVIPDASDHTPAVRKPADNALTPVQGVVVPNYHHAVQDAGDHWTDGTLTMAVIMPFNLDASTPEQNKVQMRSVEFYQGVLMAVDDIQKTGRRVTVQAYDLGTEPMSSILGNPQLLRADFIIAPMEEAEVRPVADWGESHGTPVVSPFVFSVKMLEEYEHLFQVNTQKSMLYPQLTEEIMKRFHSHTFVFVTDDNGKSKTDPYPALLKSALAKNQIPYKELNYSNPEQLMACDSILGIMDEDILFVPVTPQQESLRRMFSGLQHVKILRDARYLLALAEGQVVSSRPKMSVLGYPEWLLYTHDFIDYYYDLNVYMFSKVYVNPFDEDVKNFYSDFKYWYAKEPMSLIPKYGILGYDIAKFFLKSLTRHGQHLEARLNGELGESLQTVLSFTRDDSGKGLYNHGLYLVHFTPETTIEKIVIK